MEIKTYTNKINQYMNLKIKQTRKYKFYDHISDEEIIENEWNMLAEIITSWRLKYQKLYPHDNVDYEDLEQEAWILLINLINTTRPEDHTVFNLAYFQLIHNKYKDNNNYISCEDMSDIIDNKLGACYTINSIVEHQDLAFILNMFLNYLTPKEQDVIIRYYGLGKFENKSQTIPQIAKEWNINTKFVTKKLKRAVQKLQYKRWTTWDFKTLKLSDYVEEYY